MSNIHYLDYAATARPFIHVSDYNYHWFNPNSNYTIDEVFQFKNCEEKVKNIIRAKSGKIIFGGNASWFFEKLIDILPDALFCSSYEHSCVYENGIEVVNIKKLREYDIYCHQLVNNITGEIFPVQEIGKHIKDKNGYFICDATAGIGKVVIPNNIDNWCDCFVASSHKFGVDNKQIGFAWISDRLFNYLADLGNGFLYQNSVINGYGLVDGTPDTACAKATTDALFIACNNVKNYNQHYNNLAYYLENELSKRNIKHNYIYPRKYTNAINAIVLDNINADNLCNYLAFVHGIYISPGHSACEENSDYRVLKQYGLSQEECESTIRVSFGLDSTKQDIDALVNGIVKFKEKYVND